LINWFTHNEGAQSEDQEKKSTASTSCGYTCAQARRGAGQLWGELISVAIPSKSACQLLPGFKEIKRRGGRSPRLDFFGTFFI
jgi:hypothetical protein